MKNITINDKARSTRVHSIQQNRAFRICLFVFTYTASNVSKYTELENRQGKHLYLIVCNDLTHFQNDTQMRSDVGLSVPL